MILSLPRPVAAYFSADSAGGEAVSRCFAENAVVKDEGHAYNGRAAIKKWKDEASAKYQYTSEPLTCEYQKGTVVVTSRLTGFVPVRRVGDVLGSERVYNHPSHNRPIGHT